MSTIEQRPVGPSDLSIPVLTLGTWGLAEPAYGPADEGLFESTVAAALEVGVHAFDVAPLWGDGSSERVVGRAIAGMREKCVVVTRIGAERKGPHVIRSLDPDYVADAFEASCDRLGTNYVDVLLLHEPLEKWLFDGRFAKVLAGLANEGAVRAWGAAVSSREAAAMALGLGAKVLCLPYHLLGTELVADLEPELDRFGAMVLARSPLAHGLLTDRWAKEGAFPEGDHRRDRWSEPALAARRKHAAALSFLVHDDAPSLGAAALRFCATNPYVASVIVGARSPEQIRQAATWLSGDPRLPEADLDRLPGVLAAVGA